LSALPAPANVVLQGETDFAGFRRAARRLLAQQVQPDAVAWFTARPDQESVFAGGTPADPPAATAPAVAIPARFVQLLESLVLHDDPQRFALMYRLLWRLAHEPSLRHDPLDADVLQAERMVRAVRRDMHKTKAFVRFRPLDDGSGTPVHVAWFEPSHHTLAAVAPFFARRFPNMRWAILSPRCCVHWTPPAAGSSAGTLQCRPGARREDAPPADAGEALWLTYYRSIFNPARLKLAMMQKEMPRKYWHNLPEATLIGELAAQATEQSGRMVAQPATAPQRLIRALPLRAAAVRGPIDSLAVLQAATQRCRECPLGAHATQAVCGEGPLKPALMFVGEQPGDQEDLRGQPFVGPAGQLLDQALAQLGVARQGVYVANAVRHFKFELRGKRRIHKTPSQHEAAACAHWLDDEIRLVQPAALVALGGTAAHSLLGEAVAVTQLRGQWLWRSDGLPVLVTLHPAALLRAPAQEQADAFKAWVADLQQALSAPSPEPMHQAAQRTRPL
jgi:uracil-DNA glycosylase